MVLIDGVTEAVKHKIKEQEGEFLAALFAPLAALVVQPMISSMVTGITGRGVTRAGRGYYNNMEKKVLAVLHPLSNIKITKHFNYKPRFNGAFSREKLSRIRDGAHVNKVKETNH